MRIGLWIGIILPAVMIPAPGQNARLRAGEEAPQPLRGEVHFFADPAPLRSFQELCEKSDAIVEGVVETAAARMILPSRMARVETDAWIGVTLVLKGPNARKVVVAEDGGTFGELRMIGNYPLMQRDERYILFLWKDTRPGIPPIEDLPRYRIYNIAFGKYPVDHGKIHLANGGFAQYNGATVDAFSAEIAAQLKQAPEARGR